MRKYHIPTALVLLMLMASRAHADGLIYKLPKDGSWAMCKLVHSSSVEGRKLEEVKSDIRIASVGEITENGEPCRWIEIAGKTRRETTLDAPEGETHVIVRRPVYKLLIPEKHLGKGRMPLDHVIRGWIRRSEKSRPQKTGSLDRNSRRPLSLILSNPLKDAKPLPKVEVESKLAKAFCDGVAGSLEIDLGSRTRPAKRSPAAGRWLRRIDHTQPFQPRRLLCRLPSGGAARYAVLRHDRLAELRA